METTDYDITTDSENGALLAEISRLRELTEIPCDVPNFRTLVDDQATVIHIDTRHEYEASLPTPLRAKGTTQVHSIADLIDLTHHRTDQNAVTVTYANVHALEFVTVINDHAIHETDTPMTPGWRDHRIIHRLEESPALKAWKALDRQMVSQIDFAEHIEDRLRDIVVPEAAEMLEIATTFAATSSTNFRSGHRLQSGVTRFEYIEDQEAKAGQARDLDIPARFTIRIEPFIGADPVDMDARFRFRLAGGHLTLGYLLDDLDALARTAFDDLTARLTDEADWLVINGAP